MNFPTQPFRDIETVVLVRDVPKAGMRAGDLVASSRTLGFAGPEWAHFRAAWCRSNGLSHSVCAVRFPNLAAGQSG